MGMSSDIMSSVNVDCGGNIGGPSCILSLPDELLCLVLAAVAEMEPPIGTDRIRYVAPEQRTRDEVLGFLRLSEVCAQFRVLLLSMATLWAGVVFKLPIEPGKLALARSQSAPLPVIICASHRPRRHSRQQPSAPDLVREHLIAVANEHAAHISSFWSQNLPFVNHKQILGRPLLQLEELDMLLTRGGQVDSPHEFGNTSVNAPALRRACFVFQSLPFFHEVGKCFTFNFPALRSLKIQVHDLDREDILRPCWITDVLQKSPLLSHLELDIQTSSTLINWDSSFDRRTVQLAHLCSLGLLGTPNANLSGLFKLLGSPQPACGVATFAYALQERADNVGAMLNFASAFSSWLQRSSHSGLLVAIEMNDACPMLTLQMFPLLEDPRKGTELDREYMPDLAELCISSPFPIDNPLHARVVSIITKALQVGNIKQLIIKAPGLDVWPTAIESVVSACTAVTELVVDPTPVGDGFCKGFPIPATAKALPALECVIFTPVVVLGRHDIKTTLSCWEECVAWLASRAQAGLRVRRLHIVGYGDGDMAMYARAAAFVDEFVDEREDSESKRPLVVPDDDDWQSSSDSDMAIHGPDSYD